MRRRPSHAGRLRPWERLSFTVVLALMAALVVGLAISDPEARPVGRPGSAVPAQLPAQHVGPANGTATGPRATSPAGRAGLDAELAAAVRRITGHSRARLAVGVIDTKTGAEAIYHPAVRFPAGGVVTADLLAAVLLQHQQDRTTLSDADSELAAEMVETSNAQATGELWDAIGGTGGFGSANAALRLSATSAAAVGLPGLSRTTVADQLQLLTDLTSAGSPLGAAGRDYELGLLQVAPAGPRWGVGAAATPGTGCAVVGGRLASRRLWVINSIGMVRHAGHVLLIAVLSVGSRTQAAGTSRVTAAAVAAAGIITATTS
jgi:hypothetical protein